METREFIIKMLLQIGEHFRKNRIEGKNETANKLLKSRMVIQDIFEISDDELYK